MGSAMEEAISELGFAPYVAPENGYWQSRKHPDRTYAMYVAVSHAYHAAHLFARAKEIEELRSWLPTPLEASVRAASPVPDLQNDLVVPFGDVWIGERRVPCAGKPTYLPKDLALRLRVTGKASSYCPMSGAAS
jgi:hypothetical protein